MIRILIDSPNTAVKQGLTALCLTEPDIEVVSTADAISSLKPPGIALVDGQDMAYSLFRVQRLKQKHPKTIIILLIDQLNSKTIWAAARAGVASCVSKEHSASNLLQTVRSIYKEPGA